MFFDDYSDEKVNEIIENNEKYLKIFEENLKDSGLKEKTINKHISNVDFFLNTYASGYELEGMKGAIQYVSSFLGDWFIRKAMWSTENSIRENIASFKKFYKCMYQNGFISKKEYQNFLDTIKEEKDDWIATVNRYNRGDLSDFIWF